MDNILEVSDLRKSYPQFRLDGVSFTVPEGCITGFVGVNGAGKTTTLRTLLGLTRKDAGAVRFFGEDMDAHEPEIKNRIGVVLDEGCFYDDLTLDEMKSVIAPAYSEWSESDYRRNLEAFSLNSKQKIGTLSKGMRMKYALTLALSHKAELLIMDEPTSGLDPIVRNLLLDVLRTYMSGPGRGVLFSTHITSDLDKTADTLVMIDTGRIVLQEDKDTLLDRCRVVRGDRQLLTSDVRNLFRSIAETEYGFTGLTDRYKDVQRVLPDVVMERASVEDVMMAYAKGGEAQCSCTC